MTTDEILLEDIPRDRELAFAACEEGDNHDDLARIAGFGATSRHVLATWLPAAFDKWGVKYVAVEGWRDRGRPLSAGYFDPNGLLVHHIGATSSERNQHPGLRTVTEGRSDLRGPLCQVSTRYDGVTVIVAAGRANHAGDARAAMGNPAGDGNAMYLGNEVATDGVQPMPKAQYDGLVLSSAAILDHFGYKDASKLGLHHTTSRSGKWDLGAGTGRSGVPYDITKLRADVTARLKAGPPTKTTPVKPGSKESIVLALVQQTGKPEVYKTDGFRRQHIGKRQLAAFYKAGLKIIKLADATELAAYGPVEPNPEGQK